MFIVIVNKEYELLFERLKAEAPDSFALSLADFSHPDEKLNEKVARKAGEIFDRIIVTGDLNYSVFRRIIPSGKLRHLEQKSMMEDMLKMETLPGDLILFANDAPNFV
jgi:UDP-N-acetylmuramoyl-tripeptide--D-alanyl-D-alanine ligase